MKKSILVATPLFPPQIGGPATYSKLLLDKLPRRGFKVGVVSFGSVLKYPKILRHFAYFLKIFFKSITKDIIYAQDPVSVGVPSLCAAKILGKKFILKIVGDYAWEQGVQRAGVKDRLDDFSLKYREYPLFVRMLKKIQRYVALRADDIIVPSEYLKKIVSNWKVDREKIKVIYNAFNPPHLILTKEEARKKKKLSGQIVLTAGRLVPWKGMEALIRNVLPRLLEEFSDIKLFIVGEGPDRNNLVRAAHESRVEKKVFFLGRIDQNDLFEYIKAADVFVLNTSYEGFSHQLLEVFALGTPVVATNAGGNVEIIKDGINGLVASYNDTEELTTSIKMIIENSNFGRTLAKKGQGDLKKFGEGRMLEELTKILV